MNTTIKKKYKIPLTSRPCIVAMAKHNVKNKIENAHNIREDKCFVGGNCNQIIKLKNKN
jgi:hypothetical protein